MIKPSKHERKKPLFCFDENIEFAVLKRKCNKYAQFISVSTLLKDRKEDIDIMNICNKEKIHIITHNTKHFIKPSTNVKIGIICVTMNSDNWVFQIEKLFKLNKYHKSYFNKTFLIGNDTTIKNRLNNEVNIVK